jgi:hypothetical protein
MPPIGRLSGSDGGGDRMPNETVISRRDLLCGSAVISVAGAVASGTGSVERSQPRKTETDRSRGLSSRPCATTRSRESHRQCRIAECSVFDRERVASLVAGEH